MTDIPLTVVPISPTDDLISWQPIPGVGSYRLMRDGKWISSSYDGTKTTWRVRRGQTYLVRAFGGVIAEGVWPAPPVQELPLPPIANDAVVLRPKRGASRFSVPAGRDWIAEMTDDLEQYPGGAAFSVFGGRNWRVDGEVHIHCPNILRKGQGSDEAYGFYLAHQTGWGDCRGGFFAEGEGLAQGLVVQMEDQVAHTIVQLSNFDIRNHHPVWHVQNGAPVEVHPDGVQLVQGPWSLRLYDGVISSAGCVLQFQPHNLLRNNQIGVYEIHRFDGTQVLNPLSDEGTTALYKQDNDPGWVTNQSDVTIRPRGNVAYALMPSTGNVGLAGWNASGPWRNTGENWKVV